MVEAVSRPAGAESPVGVFDSGLGGLSVLRDVARQLPAEALIYYADSRHAPYGEKPADEVVRLSMQACEWLITQGVKALVVACNTATAHTIAALRARYPHLPVIGVEPGIKPAAAVSRSGIIGVLATANTLASDKFRGLLAQVEQDSGCRFLCAAGHGLVPLIEQGRGDSADAVALLHQYLDPMREAGADTIVLGCTHYPLMADTIRRVVGDAVQLVDTGEAVARQLARRLEEHGLLAPARVGAPTHRFVSTLDGTPLGAMAARLLGRDSDVPVERA